MYIPDNYDEFILRDNEQERLSKLHKRLEKELEDNENERITDSSRTEAGCHFNEF